MLDETRNQMSQLKLFGMLKSLDLRLEESIGQGWGAGDFLSAMVTDEKNYRDVSAIQRRLRIASFRTQASFEQLDYTAKRSLTKSLAKDLMNLSYIKASPRNILIFGPTGVGKTFLATAVGNHACRHGHSVNFIGISVLCEKLMQSRTDATLSCPRSSRTKLAGV